MKVIFVDFDGVINTVRAELAFYHKQVTLVPPREIGIDPISVSLINYLCEQTGAKIVISSSWRTDSALVRYLEFLGFIYKHLVGSVISRHTIGNEDVWRTPFFGHGEIRGNEIKAWLDKWSKVVPIEKYVILDDDADFLEEQMPFLVQTSPEEGVLYKDYMKALKILNGEDQPSKGTQKA